MLLIDEVVSYTETGATLQTTFTPNRYGISNGSVSEPALIECMAQAVAAHRGQLARDRGIAPQPGMLVGVQELTIHVEAACDVPLITTIQIARKLGPLYLVDCTITQDDQQIASGALKFFAPDESE